MRFIEEYYLNKEWGKYSNYNIALASTWNEELVYKENEMSEDSSLISKSLEQRKLAIKVARESIILLKNEDNLLPLKKEKIRTIAVIGERANRQDSFAEKCDEVKSLYEVTLLLGIKMKLGSNAEVKWSKGYSKNIVENEKLFNEAIDIAKSSEIVIFIGTEIPTKDSLKLEYQNNLIRELSNINKNTIVVISGGLVNQMPFWINKIGAVVQTWYDGMEYGSTLAEVLLGEVNPSGKLPVMLFDEKTKFSFGYGLSYTTFKYSDFEISLYKNKVDIKFNLTNVGKVFGAEVCEVYMSNKKALEERTKMYLMGFKKVYLESNETKKVEISLNKEALTNYFIYKNSLDIKKGTVTIFVGSSLYDIRLKDDINIAGILG